jgi:hypothetical protein
MNVIAKIGERIIGMDCLVRTEPLLASAQEITLLSGALGADPTLWRLAVWSRRD